MRANYYGQDEASQPTEGVKLSPRIPPIPDPAPEAVAILEKVMHVNGKPLNEPQTLAWHPLFLRRFALFAGFFLTQLMIPDRDKEILMMRTIHHARCEYLFGHHRITAREAGMSEEDIARITEAATVGWSTRDALLIGIADEVWQNSDLSDKSWAELSGVYDEPRLLEVVMLVCFYRGLCAFINTLQIEREPGVPGWPGEN